MIAQSIKQCDINGFYTTTNRQIYWPFLHSWFLGAAFMVGGENQETARAINLFFYFISVLLMYFLGRKLNQNNQFLTGLTTVLLFITSPLILFYSTTCMVEPLGFFLMLLVLNIYWKGVESRKNIYFILAGFLMGWLYLSKYIFAFFVGGGFAIFTLTLLIERRGGTKDKNFHNFFNQTLLMLPGFFSVYIPWILVPPTGVKIQMIAYRLRATGGWNILKIAFADRLAYYFRTLLLGYTFSFWIFLLFMISIIWAVCNLKNRMVRLLLLIFLVDFVPMTLLTKNQNERFICVVTPSLLLLTAAALVWLLERLKRNFRWFVLIAFLILVSGDFVKGLSYVKSFGNSAVGSPIYISSPQPRYPTLFGLVHYPRIFHKARKVLNPDSGIVKTQRDMSSVLNYIYQNIEKGASLCTLTQLNELSPHLWIWESLTKKIPIFVEWNPYSIYFVSISIREDSPYYTLPNHNHIEKNNKEWSDFLVKLRGEKKIRLVREEHFSDIGLHVKIYKRRSVLSKIN